MIGHPDYIAHTADVFSRSRARLQVANSIAAPFADWSALGALGADALGLVAQFGQDTEAECALMSRAPCTSPNEGY